MITQAMIMAAWRVMPSWMQESTDPDEVCRILAAGLAESRTDHPGCTLTARDCARCHRPQVPQCPDVEGDW